MINLAANIIPLGDVSVNLKIKAPRCRFYLIEDEELICSPALTLLSEVEMMKRRLDTKDNGMVI